MFYDPHQISPGKNKHFPPIYPPYLLYRIQVVSDFALDGKLVRPAQPDTILVHRIGILLPAFFRFLVAKDILAFC